MAGERGNRLLRVLDRCVGIPMVRAAGLLRRRHPAPERLERLGALCLGCIGDMILFSSVLADLAREHPGCRQTVFVSRANADVVRMIPSAAEVVVLPIKSPLSAARLVRKPGRFDAWLDSGQWPRLNALLTAAAHAGLKIGFASPGQHRHHVYDAVVEHSRGRHELDNFRALAAVLGVAAVSPPLLVPPAEAETELAGRVDLQRPFAVLHLFPGGFRSFMKEWPLERWAEVARGLLDRGLDVLLSGGPADAAGNAALLAAVGSPVVRDLSGLRIGPTAALLRRADLAVSVNTGIMHLAAAMDTPLVSLNGAVNVERWGAVTRPGRGVALSSRRPCAPCLHLGFEYACAENLCMRDISVSEVLAAADGLLGRERP